MLPLAVASYLLLSHIYGLDPILALAGQSEQAPGHAASVEDAYVRKWHRRHSAMVVLWTVLCTAAFACLFIFVPGHRI